MKHDAIIVVSNPFGFGPTGKAVAILEQLSNLYSGEVIYAASGMCLEPLNTELKKKITIQRVNERDEKDLSKVFGRYKNPLVVVCLNRVAVHTAKDMALDVFFVDSLTWLWKEIPKEYLRANRYYSYDIFGASKKVAGIKNAKLIPPALGKLPKANRTKEDLILLHIGGFTNPLVLGFSKEYLLMLAQALNNSVKKNQHTKIIVAGGSEALDFMKHHLDAKVKAQALPRNKFLNYLNQAKSFVTTPGMTAVLEALSLKTPIAFLPPTNLSQLQQQKLFIGNKSVGKSLRWDDYVSHLPLLEELSEKEAIVKLWELCRYIYNDKKLKKNFVKDIQSLIEFTYPLFSEQNNFTKYGNKDGAEIIVKDILNYIRQSE